MTKTLLAVLGGIGCIAALTVTLLGAEASYRIGYPTMLDMTFPEFEAAVKKTDVVLVPIGAIEEHNSHLPLGTDAMNVTAHMFQVQEYVRKAGFETILGPPLNIGITNEASDWARDGTYAYPGSLTISKSSRTARPWGKNAESSSSRRRGLGSGVFIIDTPGARLRNLSA